MLLFNYVSPVVSEIADDASGVDGGVVLYDTDLNAANEERAQRAYSSVRICSAGKRGEDGFEFVGGLVVCIVGFQCDGDSDATRATTPSVQTHNKLTFSILLAMGTVPTTLHVFTSDPNGRALPTNDNHTYVTCSSHNSESLDTSTEPEGWSGVARVTVLPDQSNILQMMCPHSERPCRCRATKKSRPVLRTTKRIFFEVAKAMVR
ncbi:predicted protein [Plenodomus lingam JN3]|uniref:Predicted protein n=1 Tax=Leptosphaeria maculans (strain JN3 / isolate v23.1.3 / race Av1-4-5-6-7-8) TaxID=985895 RepID=E4ZYI3_LEPMJ|nr:predicted protein [Plenodomus lingam JN3]CBX96509.1 predicted protein [Plenodomus lingam JN3]